MYMKSLNTSVDILAFITFVLSAASGIALKLHVGMGLWKPIHVWGSFAMIAFVLIHLILHKDWVIKTLRG
jgi:hypothetical protein